MNTPPSTRTHVNEHEPEGRARGGVSQRRLSASLLALALSLPGTLSAQGDVDRPLPNVMLLVDTSGSMEFRSADNELPVCNPGDPSSERSRWIELVEVMTGSFDGYSCFAQNRSSTGFRDEYSINGVLPYDYEYVNPFHRAISNGCIVGPGVLPPEDNPYIWPSRGVNTFEFTAPATVTRPGNLATHTGCANFEQEEDGVLDVFKEKIRFGLMTFDTHTSAGTGLTEAGAMNVASGMAGTWSYFINETPIQGKPAECDTLQTQEVGARNSAAPPWEGRMVNFGPPNAGTAELNQRNDRIQSVLLASRPYGATPIAGMMHDARDFFWYDQSADPLDTDEDFGPFDDLSTKATDCRRSMIILLSDGEPNLDLRPHCESGPEAVEAGVCPYMKPEDIAAQLLSPPTPVDHDQRVETVVIGFALDKVTPAGETEITCSELTEEHCNAAANQTNRAVMACCNLNKIAAAGRDPFANGNPRTAYFPQTSQDLKRTFSQILKDATVNLTTRTSAVFGSASAGANGGSHQFSSSFVPLVEEPWAGNLTRTRILCTDGVPEEQDIEPDEGDDFAANVNSGNGPERRFITFVPSAGNAKATLRPFLTTNVDGLGTRSGTQTDALLANGFVAAVPADVMEVGAEDCQETTDSLCRDAILGWTVGLTNSEGESRCPAAGSDCNLFGAIYHSTPRLAPGRPNEFLRDESYAAFAREQTAKERPSVLYVSTIDGQLHAMKTAPHTPDPEEDVSSKSNNELWAFFPPAALPVLQAQYPNTPATILDGPILVRDVPARTVGAQKKFERTRADAQEGVGAWRTVMLSSFGAGQVGSGYFALDVTDPDIADGGPKFLWQITNDDDGTPLFGDGGMPLITTVFLKASDADPGKEVAVAILPGGNAGSRTGETVAAGPLMDAEDDTFAPATIVNEYVGAEAARSLTIVRLDTGEVVKSFRTSETGTTLSTDLIEVVDIPAPIVGQPAAFPGATGSVADRIFVGDREGRIWRVDVSKSDPDEWTMNVFFDAFFDQSADKREPIELAPIVSVDAVGQITINVATGEQRIQTAQMGQLNRIVSLTEVLSEENEFQAQVNWVETLGCEDACGEGQYIGERVTGPMSLFGSSLYFASSTPAASTADQCATGTSRVWGLNYVLSADKAANALTIDPMNGAYGALPAPEGSLEPEKSIEPAAGIVFGVSIEQQPSCSTELDEFSGDPYLGNYGDHTSTTTVTPGKFFLVYQVGGVSGSESNKVTTEKQELTPPRNTVWVDSWAPIFE